jgi:1-acyl-sn-glycerol-3-phosphate acyltransferase
VNALSIHIDIDDSSLAALSEHKGSLIVANHKSHLDVLALISILPVDRWVTFGAKIELTKIPFFKRGFAGAGILIVDRSDGKTALQSLIDCYKLADPRVSLTLFAEGTRVNGYELGKLKPGAIKIAQSLDKEIQPICIFGTYDLMPRHRAIPGVGVITIRVLENFKVDVDGIVGEEVAALQRYMSGRYAELQTETRGGGI